MSTSVLSPNTRLMPVTAEVSPEHHLMLGGCDTVKLAERWGTPLWVMDYDTIKASAEALKAGLAVYPGAKALYAGKAFMCLAICRLVRELGLGLDVVSEGELYTALRAGFPKDDIYLHGNNKSPAELIMAIENAGVTIIVDGFQELDSVIEIASARGLRARIMVRVTPGVEPDTHEYIKTGQFDSKFGISLEQVVPFVERVVQSEEHLEFRGIHAHIGSQSLAMEPYLKLVDILAETVAEIKNRLGREIDYLNLGGGLGIVYTEADQPIPLFDWSRAMAERVLDVFTRLGLKQPQLLVEPGRSVVGTAGVTLYRAGQVKNFESGKRAVALDGGMADNPRPATYNARYTSVIASRMNKSEADSPVDLVGRFCESGDIIIKGAGIPAETGDLIAVFSTGAYNYSMSSNYNRTGKPACVLVKDGKAELIIERESLDDLVRQDRIPDFLNFNS